MNVTHVTWLAVLLAGSLPLPSAKACDSQGNRQQMVYARHAGSLLEEWVAKPGAIHPVTLPNGFSVGVEVSPVSKQQYLEWLEHRAAVPEVVKISLYDVRTEPPALLTTTYGGPSSTQGYSEHGGADRVEALGDPGLTLHLVNPHCITLETLATGDAIQLAE